MYRGQQESRNDAAKGHLKGILPVVAQNNKRKWWGTFLDSWMITSNRKTGSLLFRIEILCGTSLLLFRLSSYAPIYIYIYIYIYACVCVLVCVPTLPLDQNVTGQFLSIDFRVWNQFAFSYTVCHTKESSTLNYLPIAGGCIVRFLTFLMLLIGAIWKRTASISVWTWLAVSISHDDYI